ncbi:alpha/beta fold hydrolase [Pseudonocardia sp. CA-142604]|uniref:alpha/beta fold hydrolase n=1 Tax=Pseudonocardia sp. CA-142604 TaxID=3240024 RepID=UPI003D8D2235
MVDVRDAELACTEFGAGSPVQWLHGSGPGTAGMSNFGANLSSFGDYRNVVVDLPAWGRSPRPATDEPLLFHAAERVCPAMEALGIERAHLVGNSYGGGVAMRIAMAHPERVERLVLMAPGGVLPADPPPWPVGLEHGPTLLVWSREDQTVPPTWASTILAGIPDAELRVLLHCRHWVQYERAHEFNHIIREFLQGGAAAPTSER